MRCGGKNMCTSAGREVGAVGQLTQAAVQEQTSHESSHRHLAVSNVSLTTAHTRAQKTRSHPLRRHLGEVWGWMHTAGCCHPRVSIATSEGGGGALTAVWQARGVANMCARTSPHARTSAENSHWVMWCCEMFRCRQWRAFILKKCFGNYFFFSGEGGDKLTEATKI